MGGRKRRCCSSVPKAIRVGPSSSSPRWLTRAGAFGAGVLLVEDHLLGQAEPAAAVLGGPADAGPAALGEVSVPRQPLVVALELAARPALAAKLGELADEVLLEPAADLGAEGAFGSSACGPGPVPVVTPGSFWSSVSAVRRLPYQALAWLARRRCGEASMTDEHDHPRRAPRRRATLRRPRRVVDGDTACQLRRAARRRPRHRRGAVGLGLGPGDRVALWAPEHVALGGRGPRGRPTPAASLVPAQLPLHRSRGRRRARPGPAGLVVVADGFLGRQPDRRAARPPTRPRSTSRRSSGSPTARDAVVDLRPRRAPAVGEVEARADAVAPDDVADILFTSGTTGRSKGAMSRAPADGRGRRGPGASSAASPTTTATWWSTRSSTPSATRSASSSALITGATLYPVATSTSTT